MLMYAYTSYHVLYMSRSYSVMFFIKLPSPSAAMLSVFYIRAFDLHPPVTCRPRISCRSI